MNNRLYQHTKDTHENDDDDDDCLLLASNASAKTEPTMPKQQSIVKDNIIALPIRHAPHS
jgi:hypothetical protein